MAGGAAAEREAVGLIAKAAKSVLHDAVGAEEKATTREAGQAGARVVDSELEAQVARTASRAHELQDALPEGARGRVTMASGVGRDSAGNLRRVVGTSEPRGYLRKGVELQEGEEIARGAGHAETSIVDHMAQNGIEPIAVGAGRPVCEACEGALNGVGARITTALKRVTTVMER